MKAQNANKFCLLFVFQFIISIFLSLFSPGEGEKDTPASAEAALSRLYTAPLVDSADALYSFRIFSFRLLFTDILFGKKNSLSFVGREKFNFLFLVKEKKAWEIIQIYFHSAQSFYGESDGYDMQDLVLLQTFLGLSLAVGIVLSGSTINKSCKVANSKKIRISRQYVCQGCAVLVSISTIVFAFLPRSYHSLCFVTWMYGLGLGGYRCKYSINNVSCLLKIHICKENSFFSSSLQIFADSLKMLALERVRGKFFTRAWGKLGPFFWSRTRVQEEEEKIYLFRP